MANLDLNLVYSEAPRRTTNLESCYKLESKTRQFPFVVAHDIQNYNSTIHEQSKHNSSDIMNGQDRDEDEIVKACREFYVFHDLEHFLTLKRHYPHSHEIIRCPSTFGRESEVEQKIYQDDLCRGRLIFDFDLKKPLDIPGVSNTLYPGSGAPSENNHLLNLMNSARRDPSTFVPSNFKQLVEELIVSVFNHYYVNVDNTKLIFIWQVSRSPDKFSMHLVVKNAYFGEYWVKQMRVFYTFLKRMAINNELEYLLDAIDFQIPRRNATFRMIGSSKPNGAVLELDSVHLNGQDIIGQNGAFSIYDCLVGIYTAEGLRAEQIITMDNIDYSVVEDELVDYQESLTIASSSAKEELKKEKQFINEIGKHLSLLENIDQTIDLKDDEISKALDLFYAFNEDVFAVRDQVGDIINLDRRRAAPCKLSGIVHERENAYLKLRGDGSVVFMCRRGCKHGHSFGFQLGMYRLKKRPEGIIPLNPEKLKAIANAKTVIDTTRFPLPKSSTRGEGLLKGKNTAKRVGANKITVQVPPSLRAPPKVLYVDYAK